MVSQVQPLIRVAAKLSCYRLDKKHPFKMGDLLMIWPRRAVITVAALLVAASLSSCARTTSSPTKASRQPAAPPSSQSVVFTPARTDVSDWCHILLQRSAGIILGDGGTWQSSTRHPTKGCIYQDSSGTSQSVLSLQEHDNWSYSTKDWPVQTRHANSDNSGTEYRPVPELGRDAYFYTVPGRVEGIFWAEKSSGLSLVQSTNTSHGDLALDEVLRSVAISIHRSLEHK